MVVSYGFTPEWASVNWKVRQSVRTWSSGLRGAPDSRPLAATDGGLIPPPALAGAINVPVSRREEAVRNVRRNRAKARRSVGTVGGGVRAKAASGFLRIVMVI